MLKNKVVAVTGGAGLIGKEFVKTVLENNGTAVICDIDEKAGISLTEELGNENIEFVKTNIVCADSLKKCINKINDIYGRIDALVNNAYPRNNNYGKDFMDVTYDDFCENLGMNLGGYFLTSQKFAEYFLNQGYGNIINIGSIYGCIPPKFEIYEETKMTMPVEYAAIKSGILHLTKYMAKYFKGKNIRVNAISPGGIKDGQPEKFLNAYKDFCLNKGMLDAEDLKGALAFLLSDASKYVNGQNLIVDDGFTL